MAVPYYEDMDILWSLGLIVVLLVALTNMAGGRASFVLRPVVGIVTRLLSLIVRAAMNLIGSVFKLSVGSIKLPKSNNGKNSNREAGPPPPRWKD
ncbi:MAG: hypothetical protein WCT03_02565 [Candidatus Obscuribacterales bacterium]|jgi:hypothetical protein